MLGEYQLSTHSWLNLFACTLPLFQIAHTESSRLSPADRKKPPLKLVFGAGTAHGETDRAATH